MHRGLRRRRIDEAVAFCLVSPSVLAAAPSPPPEDTRPIAPAVLSSPRSARARTARVFGEAAPWVQHEHLTERIVPDALGMAYSL